MQDDYNRFIRRSMQQAKCNYEDIFAEDVMSEQVESDGCMGENPMSTRRCCGKSEVQSAQNTGCGCGNTQAQGTHSGICGSDKMYRPQEELPVMVFIQMQQFGKMYNEAEGLQRGTLFPALDKPFMGGGCHC